MKKAILTLIAALALTLAACGSADRPPNMAKQRQDIQVLAAEALSAPPGKKSLKVIAHSPSAMTATQRAHTAMALAYAMGQKDAEVYEVLIWLEIRPEISERVAIVDYYPHGESAWGQSKPHWQVEASDYQAGPDGTYRGLDIILQDHPVE